MRPNSAARSWARARGWALRGGSRPNWRLAQVSPPPPIALDKMVKQRRESIKQFEAADRHELAAVEKDEIVVLQEFLPQPLTEDESEAIIKAAIAESGAATMQEMGKVMAIVRPQVVGRVDMGAVSAKIKALLA